MPLLGQAALAMFWDMAPAQRSEFEEWHSREHFPERLRIPGFLRGSRWCDASGGEGFLVMYELQSYETLTSAPYLARLNDPTPWSVKMMPHHRNMVRSQCRVLESRGAGIAACMIAVRLSPSAGSDEALRSHLRRRLEAAATSPGITGAHLLVTQTPAIATTKEQAIRGGDQAADWIVLASGYEPGPLQDFAASGLGAAPTHPATVYRLRYTMTPGDL